MYVLNKEGTLEYARQYWIKYTKCKSGKVLFIATLTKTNIDEDKTTVSLQGDYHLKEGCCHWED